MKYVLIWLVALFAGACGGLPESGFRIQMYGTNIFADQDSELEQTPIYQLYTLSGVSAVDSQSGVTLDLGEGYSFEEHKIIERPQFIFSIPLGDYEGKTLEAIRLTFEPVVEGASRSAGPFEFELSSPSFSYDSQIELSTGRLITLDFRVKWRATIDESRMLEPSFEFYIP